MHGLDISKGREESADNNFGFFNRTLNSCTALVPAHKQTVEVVPFGNLVVL